MKEREMGEERMKKRDGNGAFRGRKAENEKEREKERERERGDWQSADTN